MEQVIIGGHYDLLHTTTTEYSAVCSGKNWEADASKHKVAQAVSSPGTLKNLRVELNDVPGTGTYVFTLHRAVGVGAWANTALTCTVAADGTTASDLVNEVAVAAGDVICLECNPDAPDNARYATWTMEFAGDNAKESLILTGFYADKDSTQYGKLMGNRGSTVENNVRCVCPTGGKIKNLFVWLDQDPGDTPDAYRITLQIGGAAQTLTCTITAEDRTGNDTAHDVVVSAGDILTVMVEPLNTPASTCYAAVGMTFEADTDGESLLLGGTSGDLDNTATEYNYLIPYYGTDWTATEAQRYQLAQECTLKKLYMLLSDSPGADNDYTFTVRLEGASPGSGLVVEIADAATTGNDTTNSIAVSDGNTVGIMVVPTGTPTVRDAYWGLVSLAAAPDPPTNVAATDGAHTDKVVVTWTKSDGATGYKVYEGENLLDTLGDVATYDDTAAAAPTITAGDSVASDGTIAAHVALSLSGTSANNGASRTYKLKALTNGLESGFSSTDTGYRGVGSLTYQWQRSAADSDADYSNIDGATSSTHNDTGAPANGDGRYYQCILNATAATQQISSANRGYRLVPDVTIVVPLATISATGLVPIVTAEVNVTIVVPLATISATGLVPSTVLIAPLFYGYIENITPHPDLASQDAYISAIDGLDFLAREELDTVLYKDQLTGYLVGKILDAAAWSATLRAIDDGQDTVPYAYWNKVKARFALGEIEDSELAFIYINGYGNLCYEDRHHRYSATHQTSQATFDDTMVDIAYDYSARNVYNEVRATVTPWELKTIAEIWRLEETPSIVAGATKTFWGDSLYFVDAWTSPASTTDYTANSTAAGDGDDETANITVTPTKFAKSIKLAITNNAAHLVYITFLRARGTYYDTETKISRKSEDSTSQGLYQKRTLALEGKYLTDADKAQDFCDYGIAKFKDPQAETMLTIINKDATNLTQILAREVSDRITVKNTKLGLDADFFINKIEHEITEGGKRHLCRWYVVDAENEDFFCLDHSELGIGTKLGY